MDKPVKLRPKPIELEAMPYNGDNAEDIFQWVLHNVDPMSSFKEDVILPAAHLGLVNGSTKTHVMRYLEIRTFSYHVRVFEGMWLIHTEGTTLKVLHDKYVREKYNLTWPEPPSPRI